MITNIFTIIIVIVFCEFTWNRIATHKDSLQVDRFVLTCLSIFYVITAFKFHQFIFITASIVLLYYIVVLFPQRIYEIAKKNEDLKKENK